MPIPMPSGKQAYYTSAGVPLVGGRLYTYAAGTSTPKATWSDAAGTTPNANPIILDSRGEATVFWSGAYKVELRDSANAVIWSVDQFVAADTSVITPDGRATLPSATTVDLGATTVRSIDISGVAAIQSFGTTAGDGTMRLLRFTGACSLVHNGASMILPGGVNIQCAAGDTATVLCLGGGNWVVSNYVRAARFDENDRRASTVASAATVDLGSALGRSLDISGTTTITSFGTAPAGTWRMLRFTGALTLTHNATSMILPNATNIVTAAGDTAVAVSLGSGNWYIAGFERASIAVFQGTRLSAQTSGLVLTYSGEFDPTNSLNNGTGYFTVPTSGVYYFSAHMVMVNTTGSPVAVTTNIAVDGSGQVTTGGNVPANGNLPLSITGLFQLSAGQLVSIGFFSSLSASLYANVATFSGFRVR